MNYQSIVQYVKQHKRSLMVTGSFASAGTILTLYGIAYENISFIIWGPVIALAGKILFGISLFGPKISEMISSKFN